MNNEKDLSDKIIGRQACICVVGLGFVGVPLALRFAEVGYPVSGVDVNERQVESFKKEISHVQKVAPEFQALKVTTDPRLLEEANVDIICVPTPLSKTRDPDLSFVLDAARTVAEHLHPGQLVILESTTYPGTTRELVLPVLEQSGLKVGIDFFLAYSPERIDPGNHEFNLCNTPKVVAGITSICSNLAENLYRQIVSQVVRVSSTDTAEMVKLLENSFRSVNIGLVNEFAIMCHRLGLDVWEVIDAAATKPFGYLPFYPGPGLGGHCIPVDPLYLSWRLKLLDYKARFIDLSHEINREMPRFAVERVTEALNSDKKAVNGSKILILGVAYKKDTNDIRESPALGVMELLQARGGKLSYHDPHVPQFSFNGQSMKSITLSSMSLSTQDVVIILTDHSSLDISQIVEYAHLIVDTRNLTRGISSKKIIKL